MATICCRLLFLSLQSGVKLKDGPRAVRCGQGRGRGRGHFNGWTTRIRFILRRFDFSSLLSLVCSVCCCRKTPLNNSIKSCDFGMGNMGHL